ncbi:hypothetical protein [Flavobacterium succinicans]|uniref:Uncharacterized protein n=1 Tax=Flavobacterium succinicans TaxID=29536 RepID=A0A199XQY1_9FLAO|nr:hypothetical protein [Flavobacterium succinicans]OAZ03656.1 hypothetical protein FLB_19330 [Flavobacterium succinicans]
MKDKLKIIAGFLLLLIGNMSLYAAPTPPSPRRTPPPPPKLPIDDYIGILVILSILYGFYVISNKLKAKTPR